MPTIEELVVKAKPEGIDDTSRKFEGMQQDLEDSKDEMEETTGSLQDMATSWKGAMGAIVAGLAVGTAGLLAKVPVLGEAMSGLNMIISALGFQLDQTLRPVLQPLTDEFNDLANEIYKEEGVLNGLDAVVTKIGELGGEAIEFSLEGDKLKGATDDIIEFVFPKIGERELLSAVFSFDLSAAAVLTVLFGGLAITAAKVLTFLLPATITAIGIVTFVFPVIASAAILSHIFGFNMTKVAVLGAIFGGVILTATAIITSLFGPVAITGGLVIGGISWPVIAGAAIIGVLFAGVTITSAMIIDAIVDEDAPAAVTGKNRELSANLETGFADPRKIPVLEQAFEAGKGARDLIGGQSGGMINADGIMKVHAGERLLSEDEFDRSTSMGTTGNPLDSPQVFIDGRNITSETGRYRRDETSRRGRNG